MAFLVSTDPAVTRQKVRLDKGTVTLGRHPECEIVIEAGAVSRKHAEIRMEANYFVIADLASRNGTIVNRTLIDGPTRLFDGAEISICDVPFIFYVNDPEAVPAVPTTVGRDARSAKLMSSFLLDDGDNGSGSTILGQLEVPSHHTKIDTSTGVEAKLKAILSITQALRDAKEPESILGSVIDTLFQLFVEADRGFIAMRDEETGIVVPFLMKTRRGVDDENVRLSRTIVNTVMQSQQAVLSSDAASDSRFDMSVSLADFRIRSMMAAPLINAAGNSVGVIQIDSLRPSMAFSQGDLEVLVAVTVQASIALQKFELYRDAEETRRMEQDLKLAEEVQLRFLPDKSPPLKGYTFYSHYRAATHVGGDYFDYVLLDDNRCAVIVADVVGHGVAAALLMAKVVAESRFALARQQDPVLAVQQVNNGMSGMNLDRFVTFLLCVFNAEKATVTMVNAGHTLPLICRANGLFELLDENHSGLPIGIMEGYEYESSIAVLEPGDTIVLYTDGVNEAMNAAGEELTIEKVVADLKESQAKTPESIGKSISESIRRHVGDSPQTDDICLVCVGRQPG